MQDVEAPAALRYNGWQLAIHGHTRAAGAASRIGAGRGASWRLRLDVVPMRTADALQVRAWLHALRGRSGSAIITLPGQAQMAAGPYPEDATATLASSASANATAVTLAGLSPAGTVVPGVLLRIGSAPTGQLVRATSVAGAVVTFQPALRAARAAGTAVAVGRVAARWRLAGETPAVPLVRSRSLPFSIEFEEAW